MVAPSARLASTVRSGTLVPRRTGCPPHKSERRSKACSVRMSQMIARRSDSVAQHPAFCLSICEPTAPGSAGEPTLEKSLSCRVYRIHSRFQESIDLSNFSNLVEAPGIEPVPTGGQAWPQRRNAPASGGHQVAQHAQRARSILAAQTQPKPNPNPAQTTCRCKLMRRARTPCLLAGRDITRWRAKALGVGAESGSLGRAPPIRACTCRNLLIFGVPRAGARRGRPRVARAGSPRRDSHPEAPPTRSDLLWASHPAF
jgi:hypothetical protein